MSRAFIIRINVHFWNGNGRNISTECEIGPIGTRTIVPWKLGGHFLKYHISGCLSIRSLYRVVVSTLIPNPAGCIRKITKLRKALKHTSNTATHRGRVQLPQNSNSMRRVAKPRRECGAVASFTSLLWLVAQIGTLPQRCDRQTEMSRMHTALITSRAGGAAFDGWLSLNNPSVAIVL